ncbi:MAG: exopolysaccharide Pel transporter PelG [Burkholderiales bacterium]|nr:exopolysaccharide Pel transporter PelG [Burkholderiales bacterium]
MAGIGFELRRLLKRENLLGLIQAYGYAGVISSGAWVLSIVGILVIGVLSYAVVVPDVRIVQFQVTVTYLIAVSLIVTGVFQLSFTRFSADRLFEQRKEIILTNFHAVALLVTIGSGLLGMLAIVFLFPEQSLLFRVMAVAGFVIMSNIWIATIFLSGMKHYREIVWLYFVGYSLTVISALALRPLGLEGLLIGFVIGHAALFLGMMTLILRNYTAERFISFEFFDRHAVYPSLMAIGLFYNLGVWVDKFMFWYVPATSQAVIGPFRASVIYDLPVFLAYLSIIPGMAIFLVRLETDFVEYYDAFYDAVRSGGSLESIEEFRNGMVQTVKLGIYEIAKIQTIAALLVIVSGRAILEWLGISTLYLSLLYVDVVAAGLQVVFLGILNVFFYLDKRRVVLFLTALFVVLNVAFTAVTIELGPPYYGYGFACALLVVTMLGAWQLSRTLWRLEYETFMLQ